MLFASRSLWYPKDVEDIKDVRRYEDALAVAPQRGTAAVADGVASGIFNRQWADILTQAVVADPPPSTDLDEFHDWLGDHRKAWSARIGSRDLDYFARMKLQKTGGGFTTLLWLELEATEENGEEEPAEFQTRVVAVGDCCLFHIRGDEFLRSFPITDVEAFGIDPISIASANLGSDHGLEIEELRDSCREGDLLVLATDETAKWMFIRLQGDEPIRASELWELSAEDWVEQITDFRARGQLRHDDMTLVLLRIGDSTAPPVSEEPLVFDGQVLFAGQEVQPSVSVADELVTDDGLPSEEAPPDDAESAAPEVAVEPETGEEGPDEAVEEETEAIAGEEAPERLDDSDEQLEHEADLEATEPSFCAPAAVPDSEITDDETTQVEIVEAEIVDETDSGDTSASLHDDDGERVGDVEGGEDQEAVCPDAATEGIPASGQACPETPQTEYSTLPPHRLEETSEEIGAQNQEPDELDRETDYSG